MQSIFRSVCFVVFILTATSVFAQVQTVSGEKAALTKPPISGGVLNGKAKSLPAPEYPAAAKAVRASGQVQVAVTIDENGDVVSASAVSGHPLLRASAVSAARNAKFTQTLLSGQPVKVSGVIVYNFVSGLNWEHAGDVLGAAESGMGDADALAYLTRDLEAEFPSEAASLKTVVANSEKGADNLLRQPEQIGNIVNALNSKIAANIVDRWHFELGLAKGRITAGLSDEIVLRNNLPKFKELYEIASGEAVNVSANKLETLRQLAEFANKTILTRQDKKQIEILLEML